MTAIDPTTLLLTLQEIRRKVASLRAREDHYRKLADLATTPPKTREEFEMRAFNFHEICDELEPLLPPDATEKSTTITQYELTAASAADSSGTSGGIIFNKE